MGYYFNWQRAWVGYKVGFGSIESNFWIGLEIVYLLTDSQPYRLRVEIEERSTNLWYSAEYWPFQTFISIRDTF